jgi:ATP-dependent 26S proteasome regulatory subunit
MLELLNQLDGFEATKNIKVLPYNITKTWIFKLSYFQ